MAIVRLLERRTRIILVLAVAASLVAGALHTAGTAAVPTFIVCGAALALLATLVGEATEQLGSRVGPGPTGVIQSALGNLPELFVGIFALRAGLVGVVQGAVVGSILGNSLLVLGAAFVAGGLRHGTQRFSGDAARLIVTMTLVSAGALAMPTLAAQLHTPAADHEDELAVVVSVVLLAVFAASLVVSLRQRVPTGEPAATGVGAAAAAEWPMSLTVGLLGLAGVGAALVSDWFVTALTPATEALHISQGFTGLVIVAIAGNAVENVVGIQMMARNDTDTALSVILQSSLQVALLLIPGLVLLSHVVGGAVLTLSFAPLLVAALLLTALIQAVVVEDGESTWVEGLALIGVYVVIAATFWWG